MNNVSSIIVFMIFMGLTACSDLQSAPDSGSENNAPRNYTHLITSTFVHPYDELNIESETSFEIHFESTNENYNSEYSGVLWLNRKQVNILGVHWPNYEDTIPCSNVLGSLPMASNSVVIETVIFNNAYRETTNLNQPHHKIAFVFPNGIDSNASVHVCLTSFDGVSSDPSSKSLHTLGFQRIR